MFVLPACVSVLHVDSSHGGQQEVLGPLRLRLWMIMSHYVSVGNHTCILRKSNW